MRHVLPALFALASLLVAMPAVAANSFQGQSDFIREPAVVFPQYALNQGSYTTAVADLGGTSQVGFFPLYPVSSIRLVYANYVDSGAGETLTNVATLTVQASVATASSSTSYTFYPPAGGVTFNGATSVTLPPGGLAISDPVAVKFAQGQQFYVRTYAVAATQGTVIPLGPLTGSITIASSGVYPAGLSSMPYDNAGTGSFGSGYGDNYSQRSTYSNTAAANALYTNGAATSWIRGAGVASYGPVQIVGSVAQGQSSYGSLGAIYGSNLPVVCNVGDSILDGYYDTGGSLWGWLRRAEFALAVPAVHFARVSENASNWTTTSGSYDRQIQLESCTHAVIEYGTNDISGGQSLSTVQSNVLKVVQNAVAAGIASSNIYVTTLVPRTTSAVCPTSSQSPISTDSVRLSYNAALRNGTSSVFGVIPAKNIIDVASLVESDTSNSAPGGPSNPSTGSRWYCGSGGSTVETTDGIHPNSVSYPILAAGPWLKDGRSIAQIFTVPSAPTSGSQNGSHFFPL